MSRTLRCAPAAWRALLLVFGLLVAGAGQAAIFGDDEARRAILDLRQRLDAVQKRQAEDQSRGSDALARAQESLARANEENAQLRRSLLDLANQIEQLRAELSRMRGQDEQLAREVAEVQRRLKDVSNGVEDRLRRVEPAKVGVDGREFLAEPGETRDFDAALATMRRGDFAQAQSQLALFVQRYPASGYQPSALFWLGNAQYANRNYKESLASLRAMLAAAPDHPRAPEAMLAVANAQLELKEPRPAVRKTLEDLLKSYPQAEAATVAKDRLAKLK